MVVYDVRPKLDAAKVTQHIVFLESDGQQLVESEMIIYQNDSLLTWYDAKTGTARFFLPRAWRPAKSRRASPRPAACRSSAS